jgi:hypothetical protein
MNRARDPPDLFGFDDPARPEGRANVELALVLHRASEKAWLLSENGKAAEAVWVPKSLARRGQGPEAHVWTMPGWKARELGWA